MLVCYLDDSGKDDANPITCLAGYAVPEDGWAQFEATVEPIVQKRIGTIPIHAKDLHHGLPPYEGWKVLNKQAFVADVCRVLDPFKPYGVSFSVNKAQYEIRAKEAHAKGLRKRTVTPYTFCLEAIVNWLLTDAHVGKMANEQGLAVIVETGNEHNNEAKAAFDGIKEIHKLDQLRSISFVPKEHCRAIQMADLFAYYTRRHNRLITDPRVQPECDPVLKVLLEGVAHRSYVATDFGPDAKGSVFLSGEKSS